MANSSQVARVQQSRGQLQHRFDLLEVGVRHGHELIDQLPGQAVSIIAGHRRAADIPHVTLAVVGARDATRIAQYGHRVAAAHVGGRSAGGVRGANVRSAMDQFPRNLRVAALRRQMQCGRSILALGVRVGSVAQQEQGHVRGRHSIRMIHRRQQRVFRSYRQFPAAGAEQRDRLGASGFGSQVQRRAAVGCALANHAGILADHFPARAVSPQAAASKMSVTAPRLLSSSRTAV